MAREISPVKLIAKWRARLNRRLEVGFAEHKSIKRFGRLDRRIARLAADQRHLTKEITTPKTGHLVIGADDINLAIGDQVEFFARFALANNGFTGVEFGAFSFFRRHR